MDGHADVMCEQCHVGHEMFHWRIAGKCSQLRNNAGTKSGRVYNTERFCGDLLIAVLKNPSQ